MCLDILKKKENFNIKIEGRKLEVNVESDVKLDNGVKFKVGPVKYSRNMVYFLIISDLWKMN